MILVAVGILCYFVLLIIGFLGFAGTGLVALLKAWFTSSSETRAQAELKHANSFPSYWVWVGRSTCEACNSRFNSESEFYCTHCGTERIYEEVEHRYPGIPVRHI